MNAIRVKFIAYRLDYQWWLLRKYRKEMGRLYRQGVRLSDKKALALNEKFSRHSDKAAALDRRFLALTSPGRA